MDMMIANIWNCIEEIKVGVQRHISPDLAKMV
jgi:hypothetical protein